MIVRTADGWLVPRFQLHGDALLPGLRTVLPALPPALFTLGTSFLTVAELIASHGLGSLSYFAAATFGDLGFAPPPDPESPPLPPE